MKKINLEGIDLVLYQETLPNGLKVYMVPYENKKNYSCHYGTFYGSRDLSFTTKDKKKVTTPHGIAHFLEHKMFEQESQIDPFTFFTESGTDCNASTSFKVTDYLCEGTSRFEENLDYLITYVNQPYFTDENVQKEQGIIAEEIKMYDDMPEWQLEGKLREGVYQKDPIRIDIAGTVDSIAQITKEDLYTCYRTFYQPSNMFLVITGKFDPNKALEIVKNNEALQKNSIKTTFQKMKIDEPREVCHKYQSLTKDIMNTKVAFAVKIPWPKKVDHYEFATYCGMILVLLFGMSSSFREEMRKKNYMTSFYMDREYTDGYITFLFEAESDHPDELIDEIKKQLANTKITEAEVERTKKSWIASEVLMADNVSTTLDNLIYDLVEFGNIIPDKVNRIRAMNLKRLEQLRQEIDLKETATVIMKPKKIPE